MIALFVGSVVSALLWDRPLAVLSTGIVLISLLLWSLT